MLISALLLTSLGIVVIYTSSVALAIQQTIFGILGILIFLALRSFDFRLLKNLSKPLYISVLLLLILVFIVGIETRGSLRWISFGPFNLQPSEFAKIALIITLSYFWSTRLSSWRNICISLLIVSPFLALIFLQPDLGTTLTICFIWLVLLITSNLSFLKLATLSFIGIILVPLSWFLLLRDYQKERILSFLSPNKDPLGMGYNVIQSTIAVGSGQFFGRGLGRGTQSRLQFLPEFRTDFIFAFIAEELGFIGSIIVLFLYSTLFYFLFRVLFDTDDRFGEMIVVGVISMLFFQIVVNIGMNIGVLPVTGITLPLLSYGGSSILTVFIALGLVVSVKRFALKREEIKTFSLT